MGFTFYGYDFTVKYRRPGAMHLRERGHDFVIRNNKYEFNKCHIIARSLFNYVYNLCVCFMRMSMYFIFNFHP